MAPDLPVDVVLAAMGLYAAMAHSVVVGTREIGIHVVMGATARNVIFGTDRGVLVTDVDPPRGAAS